MPTDSSVTEFASLFGALDDAAVADGRAAHAHVLREIARNSNRLAGKGGPLCNLPWRANVQNADAETDGALGGYSRVGLWRPLYPAPIVAPHKPNLRTAEGRVRADIDNGQNIYLQICTSVRPFDPTADSTKDNVVTLDGNGSPRTYSFSGIPLGNGDTEQIMFYISSDARTTLMNAANGANTGTVFSSSSTTWTDNGAAWVVANIPINRYYVAFFDQGGIEIVSPRDFVPSNVGVATTDIAFAVPHFTQDEYFLVYNSTYEIREKVSYRFNAIVMYEENLY